MPVEVNKRGFMEFAPALITFCILASVGASIFTVGVCMLSSRFSQREGLEESYPYVDLPASDPSRQPSPDSYSYND
jgi:hypothetical protein